MAGLCLRNDAVLLIRHAGLGPKNSLWAPPGGGVQFGEALTEALHREFLEETRLNVTAGPFLFGYEYVHPPLHAVELFFEVTAPTGEPTLGSDPEMADALQILREVAFVPFEQIRQGDPDAYHALFRYVRSPADLSRYRGQWLI